MLSFRADRSIQTEVIKIRLLLIKRSDQDLHNCHSIFAFAQELFCGRIGVTGGINRGQRPAVLAACVESGLSFLGCAFGLLYLQTFYSFPIFFLVFSSPLSG